MKTSSVNELEAIVERIEVVIIKDKHQSPFIRGFGQAIRDRLNDVLKSETKGLSDPNLCCVCHQRFVYSSAGYDTCDYCAKNI